jgi:hypothetical protein
MNTDHLKAAMDETRQQLAHALRKQNAWNFEVYRLQGLLRNLAVNLHEAEKAEAIQEDMEDRLAIGEAVEGLINGASRPLAPLEVMEHLRFYGFDIDRYPNPGARVHQTLNRLASAGRIKKSCGRYMRNDFNQWLFALEEKAPQSPLTDGEAESDPEQSTTGTREIQDPALLTRDLRHSLRATEPGLHDWHTLSRRFFSGCVHLCHDLVKVQGLATEIRAHGLLPAAGSDGVALCHDMSRGGQDQRPGKFDRRVRPIPRVNDCDPMIACSGYIDRRVSSSRRGNELEIGKALDDIARQRGPLAHDTNDIKRQQPLNYGVRIGEVVLKYGDVRSIAEH